MDFAGVAGIMEAEQEVLMLGGVAVAFFLFLLVTIRSAKFKDPSHASGHHKKASEKHSDKTEPRITDLTDIKTTSRLNQAEEQEDSSSFTKSVSPRPGDSAISGVATGNEDFKIFRRPSSHTQMKYKKSQTKNSVIHELHLIEQNMISLKNMFHNGHITRDVYVDETRTLYNQACALSESN